MPGRFWRALNPAGSWVRASEGFTSTQAISRLGSFMPGLESARLSGAKAAFRINVGKCQCTLTAFKPKESKS